MSSRCLLIERAIDCPTSQGNLRSQFKHTHNRLPIDPGYCKRVSPPDHSTVPPSHFVVVVIIATITKRAAEVLARPQLYLSSIPSNLHQLSFFSAYGRRGSYRA